MNTAERRIKEYHIAKALLKYNHIGTDIVKNIISNFNDSHGDKLILQNHQNYPDARLFDIFMDVLTNVSDVDIGHMMNL